VNGSIVVDRVFTIKNNRLIAIALV